MIIFTLYIYNDYFYSVFTQASANLSLPTENSSHLLHISIAEDVFNTLINLDTSKAMGPDGIPPIVLSKCASVLYKPFHYLFSLVLKYSYLPSDWKIHRIIPVFKSGDPTQIKNYQPISLLCNISKVLKRIIYNKLIDHVACQINPASPIQVHAKLIYNTTTVDLSVQCTYCPSSAGHYISGYKQGIRHH